MVGFQPLNKDPTTTVKFFSAGLAASTADLMTFPLDTAKVRLQIQGEAMKSATCDVVPTHTGKFAHTQLGGVRSATTIATAPGSMVPPQQVVLKQRYRGMFGTLATIAREEGPRAWYNGLVAGLHRQMCFASVRIGLYENVRDTIASTFGTSIQPDKPMFALRISAGILTGAAAVIVAQPTDVVKVRMQANIGYPKRYPGTFIAYKTIARKEGIRGLWRGASPNIMRNAVVNAAELVSYDLIKTTILRKQLLEDNLPCHFLSAFGAGFITTVCASPVDVVKTRIMNSRPGQYNTILHCITDMWKEAGFFAFYKGFVPNYMRLGSWNIVTFVLFEQFKRGLTHAGDSMSD